MIYRKVDMELLDSKSDSELLRSLLAEVAKCRSEISCATQDIKKAENRLNFSLVLINELIKRKED
jgi:hypothetical protein